MKDKIERKKKEEEKCNAGPYPRFSLLPILKSYTSPNAKRKRKKIQSSRAEKSSRISDPVLLSLCLYTLRLLLPLQNIVETQIVCKKKGGYLYSAISNELLVQSTKRNL